MGLCLHVFKQSVDVSEEEPEEVGECDIGPYSAFGVFRDTIARHLIPEGYPVLLNHSDCDGEWSLTDIQELEEELRDIAAEFKKLPPEPVGPAFDHTAKYRIQAKSLYDCFHNVSGENLFEALLNLCATATRYKRPITFM